MQLFAAGRQVGDGDERLEERYTVEEVTGAVVVVGVNVGPFLGVADAVREGESVESGFLRGYGQRQVHFGVAHGGVVGKFHGVSSWTYRNAGYRCLVFVVIVREAVANRFTYNHDNRFWISGARMV